jgi:putative MFS transporter
MSLGLKTAETKEPVLSQNAIGGLMNGLSMRGMLLHILLTLACGYLMDAFDTGLISYLLPSIVRDWHLSSVTVGLIASGAIWGTVLGQLVIGPMADKFGRKRMIQATLLCFGLLTGVAALAWGPRSLVLARFLAGMGLGGFIPLDAIIMGEMSPTRVRGRLVSATTLLFPMGQLLAVGATLLLLRSWGWRAMFIVGCVPVILIWLATLKMPESPRWLLTRGRQSDARQALNKLGISSEAIAHAAAEDSSREPEYKGSGSLGEFFTGKYATRIIVAFATWLGNFGYFGFMLWFPSLLVMRFHLTIMRSLSYTVMVAASGFVGRLLGIYLIEKIGRKGLLKFTLTGAGITLLLFMLIKVSDPTYILPLACIFYFFGDQAGIVQVTYVSELFPTHLRGIGTAWSIGFGRVMAASGPIVAGILLAAGFYNSIWILYGGLYLISVVIIAALGIETKGKSLEALSRVASASK